MGIESLGWMIHEKACHLLKAFDERIEDQFEWVTEALAEAKKTLAEPTIQLIPKTPSEKKKRLRIWRRHGAAFGYRRFSNNRTSNFRASYVSIKKSSPDCSPDFSNTEISFCRTDLMDDFSETTPKSSTWLNHQQQPNKAVGVTSVAVQTDDVFILQSIEPVCCLLGSGEPGICKENGCSKTVFCNETQTAKHLANSSVDLIDFLTKTVEKSCNGFCGEKGGDFSAEEFCHETNCLILDRNKVRECLTSQLVERILPPSAPDECREVVVLQTKVHKFEPNQHLQSIVFTFKKTMANESGKGGSETVLLNGDVSEALQQTSKSSEQHLNAFRNKAQIMNSAAEQRIEKESSMENNLRSPTKTLVSLAPEIVDLISESETVEQLASVRRSSASSVSSLSSAGSRSLDSLDIQVPVSVGTDGVRYSINENRDSVYCAVSYDSYEQITNSVAAASKVGSFDVSGIEVIPDDPAEPVPNAASGVCCNPSSFSLSKICGTEIDTDDTLSDYEDVEDATKKTRKRRSKISGKLRVVKQRPSYVVGPRISASKRKSLVKASAGRKSLLRSRLTAAQKNSFPTINLANDVASAETNTGHHTAPPTAISNKYSSGYRIYRSARRRSSALATRPALGALAAPSLRYQVQRTSARKDLMTGDGLTARKSGGIAAGKSGCPRRSNTPVTPVAASKSRIQKLRKLFSPHSKSKTPTPNCATPTLTPTVAPTLPAKQNKLQMWRGAELSQLSALAPGSPSTGKTWYKASPFVQCFNSRRSSVIENPRVKGKMTPGTNASCSKLTNRFTKGNQKPVAPSGDAEQSATPRRGLFKRLQDKMKTPGKDSPRACLTPVPPPREGPLSHRSEMKEVFGALKPSNSNSNNLTAENSQSLQAKTSAAVPAVGITSIQDCVAGDVGSVSSAGTVEQVKALQDVELKILIDVCSLDPSASDDDDPLIIASSDALSSYDISDLRPDSDDSDEETTSPPQNKPQIRMVPLWAEGKRLASALVDLYFRSLDVEKIFGDIFPPDLNEMFDKKKPRFDKRTSSANWEHPLDLRPFQL